MESANRQLLSAELAEADKNLIFESLDRITASKAFRTKPVIVKMFTYLVTEFVEGRSEQIKGYNIGLDVFGLGQDFDPNSNPLVRNNAVRLRELLRAYNEGEGRRDSVRIDVPKGKYVPRITRLDIGLEAPAMGRAVEMAPKIVVLPFKNLSGDPGHDYLGIGFSQQLTDSLAQCEDLRVIGSSRRFDGEAGSAELQEKDIAFVVDGDVRAEGSKLQISCRLLRTLDDAQLWGESFRLDLEQDDLFEFEDRVTERVARHLGSEFGPISKEGYRRITESGDRSLDEQTALLRWYHFVTLGLTPESALEMRDYLVEALGAAPESALLNALVANISNSIWVNEFPGADDAFKVFIERSETAYRLDPDNEMVLNCLAGKCFHCEERERFIYLFDRVRSKSPLRAGGWAMWACLFGDWDRGKPLLDDLLEHNVDVPAWLHIPASLYHYVNHDYEKAIDEARNLQQIPTSFWGPLCSLIALSQLGQRKEAEAEFHALLARRPDFSEKGRVIVERFLKDSSLREQVFKGFGKIGVNLA